HIAGYHVIRELARGGMGRVWVAHDLALDREVAIKTLLPGANAGRFVTEAKITARLPHPNIPPVYALGTLADGTPWLAMKLIHGQTLAKLLQSQPSLPNCSPTTGRAKASETKASSATRTTSSLYSTKKDTGAQLPSPAGGREARGEDGVGAAHLPSPVGGKGAGSEGDPAEGDLHRPNLLQIFEQIAQAVGFAHARGIIHRDLKPANIMVGEFGEVQVMDWGLAKDLQSRDHDAAADWSTAVADASGSSQHTAFGAVLGTPSYMAPEQARGEAVDQRADVFALGSILAALLTGKPAFTGATVTDIILSASRGDMAEAFRRLDSCGADAELITLTKRCLAPKAEDRPADARVVAAEVARYRASVERRLRQAETAAAQALVREAEQRKRRRLMQWSGATIAAALLIGLAASLWQMHRAIRAEAEAKIKEQEAKTERDAKAEALLAEAQQRERAEKNEALAKANEQKAKDEAALATAVKTFLQDDLLRLASAREVHREEVMGRLKSPAPDLKISELLLRAAEKIEGKFPNHPLVEAEIRGTLGWTLLEIGRSLEAARQFERQRELYTAQFGPDHPATLNSMLGLASSHADAGRVQDALKLREETLRLRQAKTVPTIRIRSGA
ncbi:MAG: protein kinase, partial [Gemmataceae bacterium]|nr:protein kinase [Gemmataceae bacterium]